MGENIAKNEVCCLKIKSFVFGLLKVLCLAAG